MHYSMIIEKNIRAVVCAFVESYAMGLSDRHIPEFNN